MDQHLPKRTLRPTASMPTTAETYGQKHGIDPNLTLALQNIGRRGRQSIAQPTFSRTSTAPVISFNTPNPGGYGSGFQTNHEIMKEAQGIINKEAWRASTRELQPYGSTSSMDDQDQNQSRERRASAGQTEGQGAKVRFDQRGTKRQQEEGEEEEGTEVDEDEFQDPSSITLPQEGQGQEEFPPVFQSPNLSQPELFHNQQNQRQQQTRTRFAVPDLPSSYRMKRSLPARRVLGKSVSAPVGRLGFGGMDVDEGEGEDGFDISEWAGKEDF